MANLEELIRKRAYELWELAGRPDNRSDEFWFAAEAEITTKCEEKKCGENEKDKDKDRVVEPLAVVTQHDAPASTRR
jgi:hypothetical protein